MVFSTENSVNTWLNILTPTSSDGCSKTREVAPTAFVSEIIILCQLPVSLPICISLSTHQRSARQLVQLEPCSVQNWTARAGNHMVVKCAGAVLEGGDTALVFLSKNCFR